MKISHVAKARAFAWVIAFSKKLDLGKLFKLLKTCQNRFGIHIGLLLYKKPLGKKKQMLKIGHLAKAIVKPLHRL